MSKRLRVLTFVNQYLPGQNSGGPVRSVSNLVAALGDDLEFLVVTSDRDMGASEPFAGVTPGTWTDVGKARVRYQTAAMERPVALARFLRDTAYDVLYVNSLFNRPYSILPRLLLTVPMVPSRPVVLAPRGELNPGALAFRTVRKPVFFALTRATRLYDGVLWQASSDIEATNIRGVYPKARTQVAPALGAVVSNEGREQGCERPKESGSLRVVFLARVSPMKNLEKAIEVLQKMSGEIVFDIYGPAEDEPYWQMCQAKMRELPDNVKATYHGRVEHDEVVTVLSRYHVYLLPTRGENFGHSIVEAMQAGCIPVISDQTPWQDLEQRQVGWAIPLSDTDRFREALGKVRDMDEETFVQWSSRAREYGNAKALNPEVIEQNMQLFYRAVELFG